jgi:hypothetical protein
VLLVVLLLVWPLTYRYTSVGLDVDTVSGEQVDTRLWRVRWPGDGTVRVGWIDEHRAAEPGDSSGVDLGALVLQPARPMTPQSGWNRWGFWWEDVVAARGDRPSEAAPQADRVLLVGLPHALLVLAAALLVALTARRRRRRRETTPLWGRRG